MHQSTTQPEQQTAVDTAIAALVAGDFQSRWEVAKQVRELGLEAVPALLELIHDQALEWEVRWFAARILGEFDQPQVVLALAQLLISSDDEVLCETASEALANIGPGAVAVLAELLANEAHRPFAVCALARIRTVATIEPLLRVTEDSDAVVRAQAIEALGSFRDRRIAPLLVKALRDPAAAVRLEAIATLGRRSDLSESMNLVEHLQTRLWDLNPQVCTQAAIALGRLGTPAAGEALCWVLRRSHTPEQLQIDIVRSLGWMLSAAVVENLITAFTALPEAVQQEILRSLAKVKDASLRSAVVDTLSDWLTQATLTETTQQVLIMALARLGDPRLLDVLISQLAHPQTRIYLHAIAP